MKWGSLATNFIVDLQRTNYRFYAGNTWVGRLGKGCLSLRQGVQTQELMMETISLNCFKPSWATEIVSYQVVIPCSDQSSAGD